MNERLRKYIEMKLNYIEKMPRAGEAFFHQAAGAAEWAAWEAHEAGNDEESGKILDEWNNEWHHQFVEKLWGE